MAELQRLSGNAVAALQQRYAEEVERLVDAALPDGAGADRRAALHAHVVAAARFGRVVGPRQAAELAERLPEDLARATARLRDPLPPLARFSMRIAGWLRNAASRYEPFFGDEQRLYYPLVDTGPSATQRAVTGVLRRAGFTVTDYAEGKASDAAGKQSFRIGKLLGQHAPDLLQDFEHDSSRTSGRMLLCLSRDPMDVARMSTGRNWKSCMRSGGIFFDHVKYEVRRGSLVAYLVSENDPEIVRPLGRILLKPYDSREGGQILRAGPVYGLENPAFQETAERLAAEISAPQPGGIYDMRDGVYDDGLASRLVHVGPGMAAEEFLDAMRVRWHRDASGRVIVADHVDLSYRDVDALPDLSAVHVEGDFRVSGCGLYSLHGMPQEIGGDIDVSSNRLESLEGAPPQVNGSFFAADNRLTALAGSPRRIAGLFDIQRNRLQSLEGGPDWVKMGTLDSGNPLSRQDAALAISAHKVTHA